MIYCSNNYWSCLVFYVNSLAFKRLVHASLACKTFGMIYRCANVRPCNCKSYSQYNFSLCSFFLPSKTGILFFVWFLNTHTYLVKLRTNSFACWWFSRRQFFFFTSQCPARQRHERFYNCIIENWLDLSRTTTSQPHLLQWYRTGQLPQLICR